MQGKIKITSNIEEQALIENLLNMKYSGVADEYITFILAIHSMTNKWNIDKFLYYLKLLKLKGEM